MTTSDPWAALADPTRRHVFRLVSSGPCPVKEIAREMPVSRPAVSQHLRTLLEAGLVEVESRGRERYYRVRRDGLAALRDELETYWAQTLAAFKAVAEQRFRDDATAGGTSP